MNKEFIYKYLVRNMAEKIKEVIEKSKKYSLKDAASVNATVGFGDNYVSAYAVAMHATPNQVGLLTSMPNLIAPLAGLLSNRLMGKTSRRKIFSIAILLQSLMWIPLIAVSFLFLKNITYAPILVVIFYTIYALFGNLASPAWTSWMGDLVDGKESGVFFGLRNKIGGIVALVSMILGGIILDLFKKEANISGNLTFIFIGFSLLFVLAMSFRLVSRYFVLKQYEPKFKLEKESYFSFWEFLKKAPKANYGRFSIFVSLIVLTTNIAGPFYTIYMLRDLNFSYVYFMMVNVSAAAASFFFMTRWGKFADRFGNIATIKITSFLIPIICFLWPLSALVSAPYKLYFLLASNFFSGFAWAGFNLAAGNFVFDAATPQRRGLCSAYYTILNGLGVVVGATIGSLLISHISISSMNIIMFVSLISGIARYAVAYGFLRKIKEVREVEKKPKWKVIPFASEIYNAHLAIKRGIPRKNFKSKNK